MRAAHLVLLAAAALAGCARDGTRPNVVLISVDCMNERQFEQAIGDGTAATFAALARESQLYTRAYAHAPWTTPSHMSMLSGLYPSQHGKDISIALMGRMGDMRERVPTYETISDRLAAAGYETVAFVGKGSISGQWGLAQGFSLYLESDQRNETISDLGRSEAALKSWLASRKPGRPFFLFLHTYDLHPNLPAQRPSVAEAIRYIDGSVGRMLAALRERGLYDSSLIFLTGDHGSNMIHTENKCCLHGAGHYEENLHVPLLIKLPGSRSAEKTNVMARHVDILPTVLDVVGLPAGSYQGPGTSLLARTGSSGDGIVSFSEADARCVSRRAVVTRRYKYIYTPQDPWLLLLRQFAYFQDRPCQKHPECASVPREEMYDLENDPFEEKNLLKGSLSAEASAALEGLRRELDHHLNLGPAYRIASLTGARLARAPTPRIDEGVKEALRALGYLQ